MAAQDDPQRTVPLELSHRIGPTGEVVVDLGGELDIASAEVAVSYVTDVIDRHRRPLILDLTALAFCDARGLTALVRIADYAEQRSCPFRLASPSPSLVKIMRITGLDRRFLASQASASPGRLRAVDLKSGEYVAKFRSSARCSRSRSVRWRSVRPSAP